LQNLPCFFAYKCSFPNQIFIERDLYGIAFRGIAATKGQNVLPLLLFVQTRYAHIGQVGINRPGHEQGIAIHRNFHVIDETARKSAIRATRKPFLRPFVAGPSNIDFMGCDLDDHLSLTECRSNTCHSLRGHYCMISIQWRGAANHGSGQNNTKHQQAAKIFLMAHP
jgi:hypothetical protein